MEMFMIGELASVVGLNPATIRYYEEIGLIPQPVRSESGYRLYSEGDARRLRFIQQAKMLSLSLDEIREMVHSAIDGRCGILQEELLTLLRKKLEDTRRRISELEQFEKELRRFCDDLTSRVSSYEERAASSGEFCCCLGEQPG